MTQPEPPKPSIPNSSLTTSSPLSQVDPKSLDFLFAKDPTELTDEEIERIVERLEADRIKFMQAPESASEPGKTRSNASLGKKVALPTDVSTSDLLGKLGL